MTRDYIAHSLLQDLVDRVLTRESLEIEFKLAKRGLPRSIWETVSAFANTSGGWIILGIDGDRDPPEIVGVPKVSVRLDEFYSLINDPRKISYRACGPNDAEIESVGDKEILIIRIPAAPLKERPVFINDHPFRGTYVRGNTGDFHCSRSEVLRMMRDASDTTADSTILEHLDFNSLDQRTFRGYRQRFQNENPASPFNTLDDLDFLKGIDGYREDAQMGQSGLTVAGLLLFGSSQAIRQWRSRHLIDYRFVTDSEKWDYRWDDRVLHEGNLLDAFDTIYPRLAAELPVPFRLQGPVRASESPIHVALREALVNLLVHADYSETRASLIVRTPHGYSFRNPGTSRVPIRELGFHPDSDARNPILVRMMRFIGLADEAGSGMAKIFGAWRESQFVPPSIEVDTERYEFRILLPYIHLLADEDRSWLVELGSEWTEPEQMALLHAKHEGYVDNFSLRSIVELHPADATKVLGSLRDRGLLDMSGWARGTRYELTEPARASLSAIVNARGSSPDDSELSSTGNDESLTGNDESLTGNDESLTGKGSSLANVQADLEAIVEPIRDRARLDPEQRTAVILHLCTVSPLSIADLAQLMSKNKSTIREAVQRLVELGLLSYLYPDRPSHPGQKYVIGSSNVPTNLEE